MSASGPGAAGAEPVGAWVTGVVAPTGASTGTPPAQALVPVVTVTSEGTTASASPAPTPTARNSGEGENNNLLVGALAGTGLALLAALVALVTSAVRKRP